MRWDDINRMDVKEMSGFFKALFWYSSGTTGENQ